MPRDRAQIEELIILGELVTTAREAGVQVMVEGPGHVPINQVETERSRSRRSSARGAPFYVLGPLVTDVAPGYDHITSAIGGAIAGAAGADFLCYVTPSEHLRLPDLEDVREGVIACAHRGARGRHRQGRQGRDGLGQRDGATAQGARLEGPDRAFDQPGAGPQAARVKPAERIRRLHHVRRVLLHEGCEQIFEERRQSQKTEVTEAKDNSITALVS